MREKVIEVSTPEQVREYRALADAATPGPWSLDPHYQCYIWGPKMQMVADDGGGEEHDIIRMRGVGANLPLEANGSFIAAARTAVPALCDTVEEKDRQIEELRGKLAEVAQLQRPFRETIAELQRQKAELLAGLKAIENDARYRASPGMTRTLIAAGIADIIAKYGGGK